jgi:hypothetical protein
MNTGAVSPFWSAVSFLTAPMGGTIRSAFTPREPDGATDHSELAKRVVGAFLKDPSRRPIVCFELLLKHAFRGIGALVRQMNIATPCSTHQPLAPRLVDAGLQRARCRLGFGGGCIPPVFTTSRRLIWRLQYRYPYRQSATDRKNPQDCRPRTSTPEFRSTAGGDSTVADPADASLLKFDYPRM